MRREKREIRVNGRSYEFTAEYILFPTADAHGRYHVYLIVAAGVESFYANCLDEAEARLTTILSAGHHQMQVGS